VSGPKTVRFGSVNGRYQKCDGRDFIPVSFHPGSKFSKKKNLSILKFWKADPRSYYIFTLNFIIKTVNIDVGLCVYIYIYIYILIYIGSLHTTKRRELVTCILFIIFCYVTI
jgi:hypothetical protein